MDEVTGHATVDQRLNGGGDLTVQGSGVVVANPGFEQVAQNIERVSLSGCACQKRRKPAVIAGSSVCR
jgi:hypothetical protein